jgi:hypothetical protein
VHWLQGSADVRAILDIFLEVVWDQYEQKGDIKSDQRVLPRLDPKENSIGSNKYTFMNFDARIDFLDSQI